MTAHAATRSSACGVVALVAGYRQSAALPSGGSPRRDKSFPVRRVRDFLDLEKCPYSIFRSRALHADGGFSFESAR
ncbi:hypothetical protein BJY04DRAFT_188293 [Aspergillus karnatakaensis]|uniref:uncharacterized protein n=1 Tax=Aspergillus karnatakaensis TaxID=1810916 RepID=UPI003CCCD5D4